jgi:sn-glycerol 3-phosphate transport system substrate-binding protein
MLENLLGAGTTVPVATQENGFAGLDTELASSTPTCTSAHIQAAEATGRRRASSSTAAAAPTGALFTTGECAMYMNSSAAHAGVKGQRQGLRVRHRHAALLAGREAERGPQNSIIGGATLWVLQAARADEYKGVAKFFSYLSSPRCRPVAPGDRLPADHHGRL